MQNLTSLLCAALFTVGLIACGGDDGPSDGTKLTSLSATDLKSACEELAADFPERTVDCGGGFTLTVGQSAADCAAKPFFQRCLAGIVQIQLGTDVGILFA